MVILGRFACVVENSQSCECKHCSPRTSYCTKSVWNKSAS